MAYSEVQSRIDALRNLLREDSLSTQEDLKNKLGKLHFEVTQSTVSRDLRKIGAVKVIDPSGRTVYKLPEEISGIPAVPHQKTLNELVVSIQSNGSLIIINTTPGSAPLIARHLDQMGSGYILGTIAGDDTIFVAPTKIKSIDKTFDFLNQIIRSEV